MDRMFIHFKGYNPMVETKGFERLTRVANAPTLALLGLNGALGSAILFDVAGITASAGPAGLISFLIGALMFSALALSQLELSRTFPEAGAPSRYTLYTHGPFANLINTFSNVVWYIFIAPFEAFAIIEGLNLYFPYFISAAGYPTYPGGFLGIVITLLFIPLNYFGSRVMGRSNFLAGLLKVILYAILGIGLLVAVRDPSNFTQFGGFFPNGAAGVLSALPLVMFTYASARIVADYAEEATSPGVLRNAFVWLVFGQLIFYVLFEYVFIAGINWVKLGISPGDWGSLGTISSNPFILIATNSNLPFLIGIGIFIGIVMPFLTGFVYLGGGSRVLLAASRSGYVSKVLSTIDSKYKTPNYAVLVFAIVGAILAFVSAPVHSIFSIIDYALVGGYIAYSFSAVSMFAARRQGLTKQKVPLGNVTAVAAFATGGLIVFWSGWPSVPYSVGIIAIAVAVFAVIFKVRGHVKNSLWAILYIAFLLAMTYIGDVGALSIIPFYYSSLTVLIVSVAVFFPLGVLSALNPEQAGSMVKQYSIASAMEGAEKE